MTDESNPHRATGPKTAAGKRRSSRNALRHGVLSRTVLLDTENANAFARLLAGFEHELEPRGAVESALVETMAVARWRQMRLWGIEKAGLRYEIAKQSDPADPATSAAIAFRSLCDDSRSLETLSRYETRFDRQFNRALRLLHDRRAAARSPENTFLPNELPPAP